MEKVSWVRRIRWFGIIPVAALCFGLTAPATAHAQVRWGVNISVGSAPPPLLVYNQPAVPGPDYMWIPGYWAWGPGGYYWVPGAWELPPEPGLLWTPGYWGFDEDGDDYVWHPGYWGQRVGYYGGINYGFGYFGTGFVGGFWAGRHFRYNEAVTRVDTRIIHNVYVDRRVVVNNHFNNHVSYRGGPGGAERGNPGRGNRWDGGRGEGRIPMTDVQRQHEFMSGRDRNQFQSVTHGHPRQTAVDRPYSPNSRPTTFERMRSSDRVAPQMHGNGGGNGGGHGGGNGNGHGNGHGHGHD